MPASRTERFARIGWLAGGIAIGGAAEGLRRLVGTSAGEGSAWITGANAQRLVKRLASMRGAAMKVGQLLSLEADDLLPPDVAEALASLRDAGHSMPPQQLQDVLSEAWGVDWRERVRDFDPEPIAAASIGQVHAARSHEDRELALKIQYPGVARSIDSDVDNLAGALRLARVLPGHVDFDPLIREAKRQLREEADYRIEADHLRRYAALLQDDPAFVVPRVHDELSTTTVLAMDRLHGLPLEDLCGRGRSPEERSRAATLLLRLALREIFEFGFLQSDPNFANYLALPEGRIGLLDLGAGYPVPERFRRGYAAIFRAALAGDREGLRAAAESMDFVEAGDRTAPAEAMVDLMEIAVEPFRANVYDFSTTDLPARAREGSFGLVMEHGYWRPPPPESLFLQRKLGGIFLLCVRLGARVQTRELVEEVLDATGY